jgi:hypothetical protein
MDRVIPYDSYNIQRLLNLWRQPLLDKLSDILIYVFACFAKLFTYLLEAKPEQSGGASRRLIKNAFCLIIVSLYVIS